MMKLPKKVHVTPNENPLNGLPLSLYQYWYDIIACDDYTKGKEVLDKMSVAEQQRMVNLPFLYEDLDKVQMFLVNPRVRLSYPLHIAACFDHREIIKLLLEFNVCVTCVDEYGCNALHNLITASSRSDTEQCLHRAGTIAWFVEVVGQESARSLLMHENEDGLRPVEFAAQQGRLLLLTDLLSCKGVYVVEQEKSGLGTYNFHDITEYELEGRVDKSPLAMLAFMDKSKLDCPETEEVLLRDTEILKQWIDKKIAANHLLIWMWFLLRISMIVCYFIIDADVSWINELLGNSTSNGTSVAICEDLSEIQLPMLTYTFLALTVLFYILITLTFDAVNYGWLKRKQCCIRRESVHGRKSVVTNIDFFTITHEAFLVLAAVALSLFVHSRYTGMTQPEGSVYILQVIRGMIPLLSMWSFLFFLQMVPKICKSVITMEGMLKDVFGFLVLYIIVVIPYIHVFESFVLVNSKDGCISEFSNPLMTCYTLFRMMLNMFDVSTLESKVSYISILYIMHMNFVFVVSIMMINFLIAAMANSTARIAKHEALIQRLNQLALVIALEDNLFWVPKRILRKLKKFGFISQDDRVYLISVTVNHVPSVFRFIEKK